MRRIGQLAEEALSKRGGLLTGDTDAVRLIDGEGDGIPGVFLDTFAGRLLLSVTGVEPPPLLLEWLRGQHRTCYLKRLTAHQKAAPDHLCGPLQTESFLIRENGLCFEISFQAGYSQGIFLDQRTNRAEIRRLMRPGMRLLNTFAYTGAFSVAAAMSGAETTTLDLSQPCLDWAKRNFRHNGLDPAAHHFCRGDAFHWLARFAKQGRRFDAVVLDPPTFSRDDKGRVFRVEEDFGQLASLAASVLAPHGWLLCCTNFRGITPDKFARQLLAHLPTGMAARHTAMPADFTADPYLKSVWIS